MDLLSEKLKEARKMLGFKQIEISKACNMVQADISELETGKRKFIPSSYLTYLNEHGINLGSLFDNSVSFEDFQRDGIRGHAENITDCDKCKTKDTLISALQETIASQRITIEAIRGKSNVASDAVNKERKAG